MTETTGIHTELPFDGPSLDRLSNDQFRELLNERFTPDCDGCIRFELPEQAGILIRHTEHLKVLIEVISAWKPPLPRGRKPFGQYAVPGEQIDDIIKNPKRDAEQ